MEELILIMASMCSSLCLLLVLYFLWKRKRGGGGKGGGLLNFAVPFLSNATGPGLIQPPPSFNDDNKPPWNIIQTRNPELLSLASGGIKISYKKGAHGGQSGPALFANPYNIFPSLKITVSYDWYLPPTFNFVKAGKAGMGVTLGLKRGEHSSGGNYIKDTGSVRMMWQKPEGNKAILKGYVYFPASGGVDSAMGIINMQGPKSKAVLEGDDRTGSNFWYNQRASDRKDWGMWVYAGRWNSISFTVKLNTIGQKDGIFSMTVNGKTNMVDDVVWRTNGAVTIQDLYLVSIFGGGDDSFSVANDNEFSIVKNIRLVK